MKRILIIDDDKQMREMMRQAFDRAGYDVAEAGDGRAGVSSFKRQPADLVITDLIMPEKEGIETIRELRKEYPKLKIIAISGGGRVSPDSYLSVAKTFGADLTIPKPFDLKVILGAVKELLGS